MRKPFESDYIPCAKFYLPLSQTFCMKWKFALLFLFYSTYIFPQRSISLSLKKGNTYFHQIHSESETYQKNNGKTEKYSMEVKARVSYKVQGIRKGDFYLKTKYEDMGISITKADGTENKMSSDDPSHDVMSHFFHELCKNPFYITLSPYGEIKQVEGIENLVNKCVQNLGLPIEKMNEIADKVINAYGEKAFKGNFEIITLIYPTNVVHMNDEWSTQTQLFSSQMNGSMKNSFQWIGESEHNLMLSGKSEFSPLYDGTSKDAHAMSGSSVMAISLDKKTGWIQSLTVSQNLRIGQKEDPNYSFTKIKTSYSSH